MAVAILISPVPGLENTEYEPVLSSLNYELAFCKLSPVPF